jgi:23S rRNA (adenine2030-N6)-methyltransferase
MLSYQHFHHAGNFADAHKHALLAAVLTALVHKSQKLCVFDTHAGRGLYDLAESREHANGIDKLRGLNTPQLQPYLDIVRAYGENRYPGSPRIIKDLLRLQDRMVLSELHPQEFEALQAIFGREGRVELRKADGFVTLMMSVPPPEREGMVIIDPSYEIKTDYAEIPRHLKTLHKKWRGCTWLLWYPILESGAHNEMLRALAGTAIPDILISEITLPAVPGEGFAMRGSGMALGGSPLPLGVVATVTEALATPLGATAHTKVLPPPAESL